MGGLRDSYPAAIREESLRGGRLWLFRYWGRGKFFVPVNADLFNDAMFSPSFFKIGRKVKITVNLLLVRRSGNKKAPPMMPAGRDGN